jgi:heme-degrading monooxygenase HmoA
MQPLVNTLQPPYYAVVFTSQRTEVSDDYEMTAKRMVELAAQRPGFLGVESARGVDGVGITVSYWETLESISAWKAMGEHHDAQTKGKDVWYSSYRLRICKVEREYGFDGKTLT